MLNRRLFLSMSGGVLAAAASPFKLFASGPAANAITPQSLAHYTQGTMTQALFESVKGSVFTVFLDSGVGYLTLVDVQAFGGDNNVASNSGVRLRSQVERTVVRSQIAVPPTRVQGFMLQFSISGALTEQGTYLLDHGRLGRLALFLVPGRTTCCATVVTQQMAAALPLPIAGPVHGVVEPIIQDRLPLSFQ